jgi:hypothetical protein
MKQEKPIDAILANKRITDICNTMYISTGADSYYMLICPDNRQYVIFHIDEENSTPSSIKDEVISTLKNRGEIIDIDMTHKNNEIWEIWIKDKFTDEIYMYQLTNYTNEIIHCQRR